MEVKVYQQFVDDAKKLREEVFVKEQGFSYDYDEADDVATHIVIYDEKEPVAVCRLFETETPETFFMGRFAVKKEYRKTGLGSRMMDAVKDCVRQKGGKCLVLHSQLHAQGFYEKQGFEPFGDIEFEDGTPHIGMKFVLTEER